jgi:hypothetical protein
MALRDFGMFVPGKLTCAVLEVDVQLLSSPSFVGVDPVRIWKRNAADCHDRTRLDICCSRLQFRWLTHSCIACTWSADPGSSVQHPGDQRSFQFQALRAASWIQYRRAVRLAGYELLLRLG